MCTIEKIKAFNHKNRLLPPGREGVSYVMRKVGRREVHLYDCVFEVLSDIIDRRKEVAIGRHQRVDVRFSQNRITDHAYRNIYVSAFFLRSRDVTLTIRADDFLFKVLTSNDLEARPAYGFVGIEECALPHTFIGVQRRCGKIHDFLKDLSFAQELLTKFNDVNPIGFQPSIVSVLGAAKPVIEIKSVNVKDNALHNRNIKKAARKRLYVPPRKEGDALCCKGNYYSQNDNENRAQYNNN